MKPTTWLYAGCMTFVVALAFEGCSASSNETLASNAAKHVETPLGTYAYGPLAMVQPKGGHEGVLYGFFVAPRLVVVPARPLLTYREGRMQIQPSLARSVLVFSQHFERFRSATADLQVKTRVKGYRDAFAGNPARRHAIVLKLNGRSPCHPEIQGKYGCLDVTPFTEPSTIQSGSDSLPVQIVWQPEWEEEMRKGDKADPEILAMHGVAVMVLPNHAFDSSLVVNTAATDVDPVPGTTVWTWGRHHEQSPLPGQLRMTSSTLKTQDSEASRFWRADFDDLSVVASSENVGMPFFLKSSNDVCGSSAMVSGREDITDDVVMRLQKVVGMAIGINQLDGQMFRQGPQLIGVGSDDFRSFVESLLQSEGR